MTAFDGSTLLNDDGEVVLDDDGAVDVCDDCCAVRRLTERKPCKPHQRRSHRYVFRSKFRCECIFEYEYNITESRS